MPCMCQIMCQILPIQGSKWQVTANVVSLVVKDVFGSCNIEVACAGIRLATFDTAKRMIAASEAAVQELEASQ